MDSLLNPNITYVLLVLGFLTAILAFFAPGTGLLELGALFSLVFAGYMMMNLPVNVWALIVVGISFIPFALAVRSRAKRSRNLYLAVSFMTFLLGSAFLFQPTTGWPAIHPALLLFTSGLVTGITWFLANKAQEAMQSPKVIDPDRLIGMTGRANNDIRGEGSVYVGGENWTATCQTFILAGSPVRVKQRKGLTLEVEPVLAESATPSHV